MGVTQLGMVPRTFLFQSHDQPDLPEDRLWRSAFGIAHHRLKRVES